RSPSTRPPHSSPPRRSSDLRPLLHRLVSADDNQVVRRLAALCLRNGSPHRETIVLLEGLSDDDRLDRELRGVAARIAAGLKKKADRKSTRLNSSHRTISYAV